MLGLHNNEAQAHIAMRVRASLFRQFTDRPTNVYGTGALKYGKLITKYPWI